MPYDHHAPDHHPLSHVSLDAIDTRLVEQHYDTATKINRYTGPPVRHVHDILRDIGGAVVDPLTGDLVPTVAGMLMFGRHPQRVFPFAVIDLGHFAGRDTIATEVIHLDKELGGTVIQQIDTVVTYLITHMAKGFRIGEGAQRIEEPQYPQSVIRELTVNALAHRDYARQQSIRVSLFRDRIEWHNPGRLPEGVTIETILDDQYSRNPTLLRLLYQSGYMEGFGMGWNTVTQALRDADLPPPDLKEFDASFAVTVYGRPPSGPHIAPPAPDVMHVNEHQRRIVELLRRHGSLSRAELEDFILDRSTRSIQRDLQVLLDEGIIVATGVSRSTMYRLAAA